MTPEQQLAEIALAYATERKIGEDPRHTVSTHAYYNLTGAITDIEHRNGRVDKVSMNTLKRVEGQLAKIGKILEEGGWIK